MQVWFCFDLLTAPLGSRGRYRGAQVQAALEHQVGVVLKHHVCPQPHRSRW